MGKPRNGERVYLFCDSVAGFPESFRIMPDGNGYFAYIGLPMQTIPSGTSSQELDAVFVRAEQTLEAMINMSGALPIVEKGGTIVGYVVLRLDKPE